MTPAACPVQRRRRMRSWRRSVAAGALVGALAYLALPWALLVAVGASLAFAAAVETFAHAVTG